MYLENHLKALGASDSVVAQLRLLGDDSGEFLLSLMRVAERGLQIEERSPVGIIRMGPTRDRSITHVNPAAVAMYRFKNPESMVGLSSNDLQAPGENDSALLESIYGKVDRGIGWSERLIDRRDDGSYFPVQVIANPISIDGKLIEWFTHRIDLSELEAVQRRMALADIGEAFGRAVHDVKAPLRVGIGYFDLLLSLKNDDVNRFAQRGKEALGRGQTLIEDLLEITRSDTVNGVDMSLDTNVDSILRDYRGRAESEGYNLVNSLNSGSTICVDPRHSERIMKNILDNAILALPKEGKRRVSVSTYARDVSSDLKVASGIVPAGKYGVVEVEDTGHGIPRKYLGRIFGLFETFRGDGKHGSGLGLAIVDRLVRNNNGYVDVETEIDIGTKFTLYFPAVTD